MTRKQFRRMSVFALRMVPVSIGGGRWRKELTGHVEEVLARLNDRAYACHWDHIANWDDNTRLPEDDGTSGFARRDHRYLLCDFMSEYLFDNYLEREFVNAKGDCRTVYTKMGTALSCCIRAACDVAVAPSGGVMGFTVADLKTMWNQKKLPAWITGFFGGNFNEFKDSDPVWL